MERILELARRLGEQMAGHERTVLKKKAQDAVNKDPEAKGLIEEYQKQAEKIHRLEHDGKPIEVSDKHALAAVEEKISMNEKLKELTRRQADFVEMMRKVKETIDRQMEG